MRSCIVPFGGLMVGLLFLPPLVRGDGRPGPQAAPVKAANGKQADAKAPPAVELPVTRIVLFNTGIGYFHREGDVTGDGRLDLRFDEGDVNDLLKSLILADKDGGKVRAVTYDNRMPVEFTLRGFAVDVTENPTVGQLMHQVRGEKVEVTDKAGVQSSGKIISVERPAVPPMGADPGELLNLLTEDGLQTVELKQLKKIKFTRAELQADFNKALDLLATSRGDNKKTVSVVFNGNGKRRVGVGYVTEAPLWKASYRLSVDEKGAARIQGWATIENTTDEDWNNVKIGLVAGRPMTFQMDMYDPLFVPRPLVEPELYASLRPPMYQGGLSPAGIMGGGALGGGFQVGGGGFGGIGGGIGGFQAGGGNQFGPGQNQGNQGFGAGGLGVGGGQLGQFGNQFGIQGQFGLQGGFNGYGAYLPRVPRPDIRTMYGSRLSYEEYVNRLRGRPSAPPEGNTPVKSVRDPLDKDAGVLAVADGALGEMFEYKIEEPITLQRQKSALVPLLNEAVEGTRVSIYNASVLAERPLLGLKLVNKTKLHLAQGPVTVYDGDTFAGDARLPDLKPGETRLVSYAIDLGTEVVKRDAPDKTALLSVKVGGGMMNAEFGLRSAATYLIRNRNPQDRTVIVEHPRRNGWKLAGGDRPADQTRSFYRYEIAIKSGALVTLEVPEESSRLEAVELGKTDRGDSLLFYYSKQPETKPAVRDVLVKVMNLRDKVDESRRGIESELVALKEIAEDQDRIRKNIEKAPKESDAFKRYLKKLDDQETEIEKRQARIKELKLEKEKQEKALKDYAESVKAE